MQGARRRSEDVQGKRGLAFVVEALILLAFLAGSIAVFMQLFGSASLRGTDAVELDDAVMLATNVAEHFAADPGAIPAEFQEGPYAVRCDVAREPQPAGSMYTLHVVVSNDQGDELYALESARYVSGYLPAGSSSSASTRQGVN